jgi:hypothetical protein
MPARILLTASGALGFKDSFQTQGTLESASDAAETAN